MKKLSRVLHKYKNPLLIVTFPLPILMLIVLNGFLNIQESILALWISYLLFALLFNRVYCGYICQFGMFQRFFNIIGEIIFKKSFRPPEGLDKLLRMFKYIFVFVLIPWSIVKLEFLISDFPFNQYSIFWDSLGRLEGALDITVGLLILSSIIGSVLVKSFYCKYLCIKGAVFGLIATRSASHLKIDRDKCISCKVCTSNCPMNLQVHAMETNKIMDCINCYQCIAVCPKKAIHHTFFGAVTSPVIFIPVSILTFVVLLRLFSNLF